MALAFCGNGKAIFLDEPTTGLDQNSRRAFWNFASEYAEGGASLIITTHHLEEIEDIATRICMLVDGKIRFSGSAEKIRSKVNRQKMRFCAAEKPDIAGHLVKSTGDGRWSIYTSDSDEAVRALVRQIVQFNNLEIHPCSLKEAVDTLFEEQSNIQTGA